MSRRARKQLQDVVGVPSLRQALDRVLPVTTTNTAVASSGLVAIRRGRVEAYDGRIFVSCPVDLPPAASFAVPAALLDKAVTADSYLDLTDKVIVRHGRYRTSLNRLDNIMVPATEFPPGEMRAFDLGLIADLIRALPFVATDASLKWACNVIVRDGVLYATNRLTMIRIEPALPCPLTGLIPFYLIELLKQIDPPAFVGCDERTVMFSWPDGGFIRALRFNDTPTESIFKLVDEMRVVATPISDEWRAAYRQVASYAPKGPIRIKSTGYFGTGTMTFDAEAFIDPALALGDATLNPKDADAAIEAASHLELHPHPGRCYFSGERLTGLMLAMKDTA